MRGLDPRIHQKKVDLKKMDCRVKPGNDEPFPSNAKRLWDGPSRIGYARRR
jgi:hypothetical protein